MNVVAVTQMEFYDLLMKRGSSSFSTSCVCPMKKCGERTS